MHKLSVRQVRRSALWVGMMLGLAACARSDTAGTEAEVAGFPWSDRLETPAGDPYAGGRSYPWEGVRTGATGLAAAEVSGENFLSDLTWTSAQNAWGPVEKDQSNGDKFATDGRSLTVGGQTFSKGLGVHANSEVSYALGGMCNVFTAQVGVDDEVGSGGSVVFQVWSGTATKLYDSGLLRGTDAARAINLDITGVQDLRLVVTDGGNGISSDHADWAAAKVSCPPRTPGRESFLSDLTWTSAQNAWGPLERDRSNGEQGSGDGRALTVGGQVFSKGLGVHARSEVSYALDGACSVFTAQVGVDDEVGDRGAVVFQVWNGTATRLYDSGVVTGTEAARAVNVDVTGVGNLRLVVTDGGNGISYDHADWAGARVTCAPDSRPPAAPTGLTATPTQGGIALAWGDVADADLAGYRVERAAREGGPFAPATPGTLTASNLSDPHAPEDSPSFYRVRAVDAEGNVSAPATASTTRPRTPAANTFTFTAVAPQPHNVSEAQGRMVNGRIYTFGGFDSLKSCCTPTNRALVYDPAANTWTALAPLPDRGGTHMGIASDGAFIYIAGGYLANSAWNGQVFGARAVWRYSIADNTYTRLPDLPVERSAGQLEHLGGRLHYFGGTNLARTQNVGDHYVLDLAAGATSWTTAAPLPNPRHHLGSAVLGGLIYAVGGQYAHDEHSTTQPTLNVYDPQTNTWATRAPLPRARGHISNSTFVLGGRLIVAGGEVSHGRSVADVSAYDPQMDTWTALTPLPSARSSGVAAATGAGYVYSGGSWTKTGWRATP
ncbi:NPCBM/NEW2 domain-containing protein [Deinococcus sp. YIM 134068]|uniref:NPCBM/NEW2 domain-containing protein n=1 Tax=Deinococcus lichenicola TaxID=3118910 RepID=UPI002F91FA8A